MQLAHPSTTSLARTAGLMATVLALVVGLVAVPSPAPAHVSAAPVPPLSVIDTWAWCGVHPDDPVALASARSMATVAGIDATFGPCNVPTPDYTPANTANRAKVSRTGGSSSS